MLKKLFAKLRSRIPGLVLRTSIITGLPGEDDAAFEELCVFLKEQRLERVGAFAFSPEEGTPAAQMDHVDLAVAQQRQFDHFTYLFGRRNCVEMSRLTVRQTNVAVVGDLFPVDGKNHVADLQRVMVGSGVDLAHHDSGLI